MIEPAAHVATGIAILQASDEYLIESRSGNNAELAEAGNRMGEPPVGDSCSHPALNDGGVEGHWLNFII